MLSLFSYSGYVTFFKAVSEVCKVLRLCDWQDGPGLILRHDVDLDIGAAHRLSRSEIEADVRSTYFFLTSCATYNVSSAESRKLLRQMANDGFEIGLHFDPTIYEIQDVESLSKKVAFESRLLSEIVEHEVRSISLHNPSVHNSYPLFSGYLNAYDKKYFSPERYLSDSRMLYRRDPWEFCHEAASDLRQLLIHPMHISKDGKTYPQPLVDFVTQFVDQVDAVFRGNSEYERQTPEKLIRYLQPK